MEEFEGKAFKSQDFSNQVFSGKEYFNCSFENCDFSNADLSHIIFVECVFIACNMKMVHFANTTLRDVSFRKCNCLGINFFEANRFMLRLEFIESNLQLCSFNTLDLKKTVFDLCELKEADFSECNLSESVFSDCDLSSSIFDRADLRKANLLTSYNYNIDPELTKLDKAKFSVAGLPGLLSKYNLHIE